MITENRMSGRTRAIAVCALAAAFGILMSMHYGPAQAAAQPGADLLERAKGMFEPIPTEPPQLPGNALTPEKIEEGRRRSLQVRISTRWRWNWRTTRSD